jgi:hypothetical protein
LPTRQLKCSAGYLPEPIMQPISQILCKESLIGFYTLLIR